jgi:hypothetical protein
MTASGTTLYAATSYAGGDPDGTVLRSTNSGASWDDIGSNLPPNLNFISLAVHGTTLFAGSVGGGVYRTSNEGDFWTEANNGLPADAIAQALVVSGASVFVGLGLSSGDALVFQSTDFGISWTEFTNGLTGTFVKSLASSDDTLFAGIPGGGVWKSEVE